jgi:hypothetical protein
VAWQGKEVTGGEEAKLVYFFFFFFFFDKSTQEGVGGLELVTSASLSVVPAD